MNSNGNGSPVALAQIEKNINKYRRLSASNPQFKNSLASAEKKYENISRTQRLRNVERSVSPGTVRALIEQLNSPSPKSSPSTSPVGFMGGRRRRANRKTRRRVRKTRGRK